MLRSDVIPIDRFPIEDPIAERVRQIQLGFNELRLYETHVGTQEDPSQHEALGAFQLVREAQLEVVDIIHAGYAFVSVQTEHLPPGLVCHVCHSRRLFIKPPFYRFITSLTSSPSFTSFVASTGYEPRLSPSTSLSASAAGVARLNASYP